MVAAIGHPEVCSCMRTGLTSCQTLLFLVMQMSFKILPLAVIALLAIFASPAVANSEHCGQVGEVPCVSPTGEGTLLPVALGV